MTRITQVTKGHSQLFTLGMDPWNTGRERCTQVGLELTIAKYDYFYQNISRIKFYLPKIPKIGIGID